MNVGHNSQKAATVTGAATGAQTAVNFQLGPKQGGLVQLKLGGTGTIRIQGRISPEADFVDLTGDISAAGVTVLTNACPEMRVNVTANSATVDVWIMA